MTPGKITKATTKPKKDAVKRAGKPTSNADVQAVALRSLGIVLERAGLAAALGRSYEGDRDLFTALGYPKTLGISDYFARYKRQDIAKTIIDAPVMKSWRDRPVITESEEKETKFELAWLELVKNLNVYHYLTRVDKLACIGQYAVLMMGFDDNGQSPEQPAQKAKRLLYLMPYAQDTASIDTYETGTASERYGKPVMYRIKPKALGNVATGHISDMLVHHSRIIHVAPNPLENDTLGTPVLECVWNRLQDLGLVSGSSAEMFFRGAYPGLHFDASEGATQSPKEKDDFNEAIEAYLHEFTRILKTRNVDVKQLLPQVADPSNHVSVYIDLIACATRIPKRILLGSERGELSSAEDERNWAENIDARRKEHCEPVILRPFIDSLIQTGVLPKPKDGYTAEWPDAFALSEDQKVDLGAKRSKALRDFTDAVGSDELMPIESVYKHFLALSDEAIEKILAIREEFDAEDARLEKEDEEAETE